MTQIKHNVLVGLKRFCNLVRWKFYWLEEERKRKDEGKLALEEEPESREIEVPTMEPCIGRGSEGLGTGLRKPNTANSVPIASKDVEAFLDDLVHTLLKDLSNGEEKLETNKAQEIKKLAKSLQQ